MKRYLRYATIPVLEFIPNRGRLFFWRFRIVISTITLFYLWDSVLHSGNTIGNYSSSIMLTYIFVGSFISNIMYGSRSFKLADLILNGDFSHYLLKPINYFFATFMDDIGQKSLDTLFSLVELTLLFVILQPLLFIQVNSISILLFCVSLFLAMILIFIIGVLFSSIAFWSSEVWGPRFLFNTIIVFAAGIIFPLDILPENIYQFLLITPFPYMNFFPISLYLGKLQTLEIFLGFFMSILWIIILYIITTTVWKKGLKMYASEGR